MKTHESEASNGYETIWMCWIEAYVVNMFVKVVGDILSTNRTFAQPATPQTILILFDDV